MALIVRNFTADYPWWKKAIIIPLNILAEMPVTLRESRLRKADYKALKRVIKKGDIMIVGSGRKFSKYFIAGPFTHSLCYVGGGKFIHAAAGHGVEKIAIKDVIAEYDHFVLLRLPSTERSKMSKVIKFLKQQLGQPYDFEFRHGEPTGFYCSELIYFALKNAGVDVSAFEKEDRYHVPDAAFNVEVHPMHYLSNYFEVVHMSDNLERIGDDVRLKGQS